MKFKLLLPIIVLSGFSLFTNVLYGQNPDELMILGNKFYQQGLYEQAIDEYHKIISQGYESSTLYYNLGNSYFKAGKIGLAILYYEKGLRNDPGNEDILYNLRIANSRTVDKIIEVPKIFIVKWWELLVTTFSLIGWLAITVVIYLIFLVGIGFYFLSRKLNFQRIGFLISSIALSVLIIAIVISISRYNHEVSTDFGILVEQVYSVKTSPDVKGSDAFIIHEGIKFSIEDEVNNWIKIRLADGKVGWIPKNVFGQI
jgi:tetratricopeptide (TPR) repeat protein